jgi:hypothetical protein
LTDEQIQKAKTLIFKNGRLLERKLWEYFFEAGSKQACIKALLAYQNADGGFGNGIEPDLLCPDSSAVGAEVAMHVLELLECHETEIPAGLIEWIVSNQNEAGYIDHPPQNMLAYPYQPWWKNSDPERILMLAGIMKKWGIERPRFFEQVRTFYLTTALPPVERYYGYPHFVYLKYCGEEAEDRAKLATMVERLPAFLTEHRWHFPLLSRGWMYAREYISEEDWEREASIFMNSLQEDGGVKTLYPDLPWWRPIWTLNGCVLLSK